MSTERATVRATSPTGRASTRGWPRPSRVKGRRGRQKSKAAGQKCLLYKKKTGPAEDDWPRRVARLTSYYLLRTTYFVKTLSRDELFQSHTIRNYQRRAALLDDTLFFETSEQTADGLARGANHLPDLFVRQSQFHRAGIFGFDVLIEPSDHQTGKLFAGRVGQDEVTNLAASGGVIRADVLRHPQGKFSMQAHEAHQITLSQEGDLGRFLRLGRRFIGAAGDYRRNSQWAADVGDAQNQSSAVATAHGELHMASAHNEHAARRLSLGKQNRPRGIAGGDRLLFQGFGNGWGKIAESLVYRGYKFLGVG